MNFLNNLLGKISGYKQLYEHNLDKQVAYSHTVNMLNNNLTEIYDFVSKLNLEINSEHIELVKVLSLSDKEPQYQSLVAILSNKDKRTWYVKEFIHLNSCNQACLMLTEYIDDTVEIVDIYSTLENKGYGTILLQELTQYASKKSYKKIIGELSPVDRYNREKQIHFYTKNGFSISNNSIQKSL